jgi:hypothetical protein
MAWKMPSAKWAALTYAIAAVGPIGSWLLLLFYAMPTNYSVVDGALDSLGHVFAADNTNQWWFIGWAVLPIYLIVLSALYLSHLPRQRGWALGLFGAALFAVLYALFAVPPLGIVLLLALYLSYRCVHDA